MTLDLRIIMCGIVYHDGGGGWITVDYRDGLRRKGSGRMTE